jgi:tetratricopeptide (TPR) repeat protein
VFIVTGLEGVGRRAYMQRATKDNLGLHLGPFFLYDETKRPEDIYLWLFNETDDLKKRSEIKDELQAFGALTSSEQVAEILNRLKILCRDNCIPAFVDHGGMLEETGQYVPMMAQLLQDFKKLNPDFHLVLVHQRTPFMKDLDLQEQFFQQALPPLDRHESKLLLQQLFRNLGVKATELQTSELLEYLGGYPPSIYLAARHAQTYGIDVLLADKAVLVDFQVKRFTGLVNKLKLVEKEWLILRYLCSEQVVPLSVIALAVGLTAKEVAPMLRNLIEQSLVVVVDDNYGLSSPIKGAIERVRGNLDTNTYLSICKKLTKEFWEGEDAAPIIEVVDATLHAAARAGVVELTPYADLLRVSTLHKLARECYHRREWAQCLKYVERAEQMDPLSFKIRELHFRALLRVENWEQARTKLAEIQKSGSRNYYYLKGFYHRVRHEYRDAVEAFKSAELLGFQDIALSRDHAECLHRLGKDEEALKRIEAARRRDPANIFILDLYIRISLANHHIQDAEDALKEMERYDVEKKFLHHRRSRILAEKKLWNPALAEAEAALKTGKGPFEAHAQRIDILIELQRYDEAANALEKLKAEFGGLRKDVQFGLKCKFHIRQGNWKQAETIWGELKEKDSEINNAMLRQIYELKAKDDTISLMERKQAADEVALLDPDLRNVEYIFTRPQEPDEL